MTRKNSSIYIIMMICLLLLLSSVSVLADVFDNAKSAYELGDYEAAASLFKQHYDSLSCDGTDATCAESKAMDLLNIGRCKRNLRQFNELRLTLSTLIENHNVDSDISAEAQYLIGFSYKEEKDLQKAIQALDKLTRDYPDNGAWCSTGMLLMGDCQRQLEQFGDATQTYKFIISNYADKRGISIDAKTSLVQTLMEAGRIGGISGMWAALDNIIIDYGSDAEICAYADYLKSRYANNGIPDFAEAATIFKAQALDNTKAIDTSNLSCLDMNRLAEQSYVRCNYAKALALYKEYYQKCLGCDEHDACRVANISTILRIGQCGVKLHDYANARTWLLQIISKYPVDVNVYAEVKNLIAESYAGEGMNTEALAVYDSMCSDYPSDTAICANATLAKGKLQRKLRRYEDSIKTFRLLIEKYPDQVAIVKEASHGLAEALVANKQTDEALLIISHTNKAGSRSAEQKAESLYWKATILARAMRYAECRQTVEEILSNYSEQSSVCRKAKLLQASSLFESGELDSALSLLNQLRQDKGYSHGDQARILLWAGLSSISKNAAAAEEYLSAVISEYADTPISQQAYMHRAIIRVTKGDYEAAMSDIQMIQVPCWKFFAEGEYYYAQDDFSKAAVSYNQGYLNYKSGEMPVDIPSRSLRKLILCYNNLGERSKVNEAVELYTKFMNETK